MVLGMPTDTSLRCPGLRPHSPSRIRAEGTMTDIPPPPPKLPMVVIICFGLAGAVVAVVAYFLARL
jgi:hypothetical protein